MTGAVRDVAAGPREVLGPLDLRPIGPADIEAPAHDMSAHLRAVKAASGHRAAVTAALAAILAGVIVTDELGGAEAVADALREHLATAERRVAERAAGARRATLN